MTKKVSIVDHRLIGDPVKHLVCAKNRVKLVGPDMIVLHYTAAWGAESAALYLTRPDVKASAHLVIGRDGQIIQLVPFDVEAWHAGVSWYAGRSGLNHYSIGIELDNLGMLQLSDGVFVAGCGRKVPAEDVFAHESGGKLTYWHHYTRRQVQTLVKVCRVLREYYPIREIVGHSTITNRKVDPGPALEFALAGFREARDCFRSASFIFNS